MALLPSYAKLEFLCPLQAPELQMHKIISRVNYNIKVPMSLEIYQRFKFHSHPQPVTQSNLSKECDFGDILAETWPACLQPKGWKCP